MAILPVKPCRVLDHGICSPALHERGWHTTVRYPPMTTRLSDSAVDTTSNTAFAAFFYTVDFIRTYMKMPVNSPMDLEEAALTICSSSWDELRTKAPNLEKRLPDYCAAANFVYLLTVKGYEFNNSTFSNIRFEKKAGDTSIGWALGYMLNLTNMIPADELSIRKGTEYTSWVVLILLFIAIILAAVILLFCLLCSGKQQSI